MQTIQEREHDSLAHANVHASSQPTLQSSSSRCYQQRRWPKQPGEREREGTETVVGLRKYSPNTMGYGRSL